MRAPALVSDSKDSRFILNQAVDDVVRETPQHQSPHVAVNNGGGLGMSHEEIAGSFHRAEEFSTQSWSLLFVPSHFVKHLLLGQAMKAGNPYDAVIMDLTIPGGMGGKEAVKKVLEIDPQAAVIVSSGYATDPIMSEFKKYGFKAVIAKPYSVKQLQETLSGLPKRKVK